MKKTLQKIPTWVGMSVIFVALCLLLFPSVLAWSAENNSSVAATDSAARIDGSNIAIDGFERLNKGTSRDYQGQNYGYRYPMVAKDAFAVLVLDERRALVYMPDSAAFDLNSDLDRSDFETMLLALDSKVVGGGRSLANLQLSYNYTNDPDQIIGGVHYRFAVQIEPEHYYATIMATESEPDTAAVKTNSEDPLFCFSGLLVPATSINIAKEATGLAALSNFLGSIDFRPFWVSLKTSAVAMLFVFVLGLAAAWFSQRINDRLKGVLDAIFTIPMVLPPTVCGFLLLIAFGNSTGLGQWLLAHNIQLIFSWPAAVIAAVVVSFPLMYRTARGAFEGLDPSLSDAARTLGWSERRIFFKLTMPLAWPSIAAGTVLAFARAMGEFGATLFVAGNYPGVTQTMPIAIYFEWMGGHSDIATFWVFVVIAFSFVVILFVNWYAARTQRYRQVGADKLELEQL